MPGVRLVDVHRLSEDPADVHSCAYADVLDAHENHHEPVLLPDDSMR